MLLDSWIDALCIMAGISVIAHGALCAGLSWRLRDREALLRELFTVPNSWLSGGETRSPNLLRARFYLPWKKVELGSQLQPPERTLLMLARISGLLFPLSLFAFFLLMFAQAA